MTPLEKAARAHYEARYADVLGDPLNSFPPFGHTPYALSEQLRFMRAALLAYHDDEAWVEELAKELGRTPLRQLGGGLCGLDAPACARACIARLRKGVADAD